MRLSLNHKPYRLPFRQPMRTAHGVWAEREGMVVRVEDEHGRVGFGEIAPIPGWGGGTLAEATEALARLGRQPSWDEVSTMASQGGVLGFALGSALEASTEDVASEREYLAVAALLPAGRSALAGVETKLELGFRTFKWKVGVDDERAEQGLLDEIMERLPEGARLRLDANGGWDRRQAERWLGFCADRPMIEFVEQPTDPGNVDLLLGLVEDYPTTLALDESVVGRADFERWQGMGWPGVFVIKPALWGDPQDVLDVVGPVAPQVVISSALETACGARRVLELAFAMPGLERALGTGVWPLFAPSRLNGPTALPFLRKTEVEAINAEEIWEALET